MVDIRTIIDKHQSKYLEKSVDSNESSQNRPTFSEIPDMFFNDILREYKLNRIEIMVLMHLYAHVWCRPNLYKKYGISQILSLKSMTIKLGIDLEEIHQSIKKLEGYGFIMTIRVGQYFVRKYFTKVNDDKYNHSYDDFD